MITKEALQAAKDAYDIEAACIREMKDHFDDAQFSAAVELLGGSARQCLDAASTVLMNMLGLVCDPVGGLVEYPCQNRNAAGVANAVIAAQMALAGIPQLIPLDEMMNTMYTVGRRLPPELRETALGGCAVAPSACAACCKN